MEYVIIGACIVVAIAGGIIIVDSFAELCRRWTVDPSMRS